MDDKTRKSTATITWVSYYNYGTSLQAYALQTIIRSLGFDNKIISDARFVRFSGKKVCWWKRTLSLVIRLFSKSRWVQARGLVRMKKSYASFSARFLDIDEHWSSFSELDKRYDIYVCGSDQIWSPLYAQSYYFAGFTGKKKIAYAPSLGLKSCSNEWKEWVRPLLARFSHLSVREAEGAALLGEIVGKPVPVVLDPTLLLPSEDWKKLADSVSPVGSSSYVLAYFLSFNPAYWAYVRHFAHERKLPLRFFAINREYLKSGDKALFAGPLEFLQQISGASYVFTDSFHGTIFSIHFEKRFFTLKRFKEDAENNQNSRVVSLFSRLGLEDYFIDEEGLPRISSLPPIDYVQVKEKISKERTRSLEYLKNFLES